MYGYTSNRKAISQWNALSWWGIVAPVGNYKVDAPMPKDGKYRIITFDGGGLRSVVSIIILERLVEVFPDLLERINLFSGTSGSLT